MSYTFDQTKMGYVCGVSMSASGCGPCAIASIVYNSDISITPQQVAEWMYKKGYWMREGSTRLGVTYAFEHYGYKVQSYLLDEHRGGALHTRFCEEMKASADGETWGVMLAIGDGAHPGRWTNGGHFLSVTSYNPTTDKYYVRDSGSRHRTGWFSPSEFKGDVNVYYVVTKKEIEPAAQEIEHTFKVEYIKLLQAALNKSYGTSLEKDGSAGPKTMAVINAHPVKKGVKNEHARWLQQMLYNLGYTQMIVDGDFGSISTDILGQFQAKYGLTKDYCAGQKTHQKILDLIK